MIDHDVTLDAAAARRNDRAKAAVIAVMSVLLYSITRTRHFGGDDTVFALVVQR